MERGTKFRVSLFVFVVLVVALALPFGALIKVLFATIGVFALQVAWDIFNDLESWSRNQTTIITAYQHELNKAKAELDAAAKIIADQMSTSGIKYVSFENLGEQFISTN